MRSKVFLNQGKMSVDVVVHLEMAVGFGTANQDGFEGQSDLSSG